MEEEMGKVIQFIKVQMMRYYSHLLKSCTNTFRITKLHPIEPKESAKKNGRNK